MRKPWHRSHQVFQGDDTEDELLWFAAQRRERTEEWTSSAKRALEGEGARLRGRQRDGGGGQG